MRELLAIGDGEEKTNTYVAQKSTLICEYLCFLFPEQDECGRGTQ